MESEGRMSSESFVKMIEAYRSTLGTAYPRQDIAAVVRVFRECADCQSTTQDRIRQTTGLAAGNLSKIVKRASEKGWIRTAAPRGAGGTKEVSLTPMGRVMLDDFEARCSAACSRSATARKTPTRAAGKKTLRSRIAESKAQSGYLSPELAPVNTKMPTESG
jgi:DNA-binding MarR family transcriptional regulator